MGIEHPQMSMIAALFFGAANPMAPFPPAVSLLSPGGKTPNQRALACAIGLAWSRVGKTGSADCDQAIAAARSLFHDMSLYGHQATAPSGPGSESGAPAPHDELWMGAMATILREARLQGIPDLYAASVRYFADHVAIARAFWTPAGVRMPGSRAKRVSGLPFAPSWPVDSAAYAMIAGLPTTGLLKPTRLTLDILRESAPVFSAILAAVQPANVLLRVPIRRWDLASGGFLAAQVEEIPMNDRLAWIMVDGAGAILGASGTLADLPTVDREPDLVFGAVSGNPSPAPLPAPPPLPPVPLPPITPPSLPAVGVLTAAQAEDFYRRLFALRLSHTDSARQATVLDLLHAGLPLSELPALTDRISALGIGAGQPQFADRATLVSDMRAAANGN